MVRDRIHTSAATQKRNVVFQTAYVPPMKAGSVDVAVSHGIAAKAAVRPTMPTSRDREEAPEFARAGREPAEGVADLQPVVRAREQEDGGDRELDRDKAGEGGGQDCKTEEAAREPEARQARQRDPTRVEGSRRWSGDGHGRDDTAPNEKAHAGAWAWRFL